MNFAQTFKHLRKLKNKTQEAAAKDLSVSKSTIAMWETNKRTPDFEKTEEIADYFNVDLDYLMGRKSRSSSFDDMIEHPVLDYTYGLSDDERILIEAFRSKDNTYRKMIEMIIFNYKQSQEGDNNGNS